ncbi:glycosyltransferase WbuB [Paraoerskovia sediminicola]|uniref:D-inositol 3-phosphate glycosyltransferase n=1 Tax=Paraoerskovia sediminicola TaxID=1138587 RepID=A0ABN6XDN9_9CELL|nr:glycosyltransferase WbuB [Paraoerskovia sediminicola]
MSRGGGDERAKAVQWLRADGQEDLARHALVDAAGRSSGWDAEESRRLASLLRSQGLLIEAGQVFRHALTVSRGDLSVHYALAFAFKVPTAENISAVRRAVKARRVRVPAGGTAGIRVQLEVLELIADGADVPAIADVARTAPKAVMRVTQTAMRAKESDLLLAMAEVLCDQPGSGEQATFSALRSLEGRGEMSAAARLARSILDAELPMDEEQKAWVQKVEHVALQNRSLLRRGWPAPARASRSTSIAPRRVAYLLHNSLPANSGGYATRSHGILTALRSSGWDVEGLTRPGYPYDRHPEVEVSAAVNTIDGVRYARLPQGSADIDGPIERYVETFADSVVEQQRERGYGIVHAASFFYNGLAAVSAARRLGLPSVYEVRGLMDVTFRSNARPWVDAEKGDLYTALETAACVEADRVLVITEAVRDLMVERGVDAGKISVLPNGVDSGRFEKIPRDDALARHLGIGNSTVIGYVGSMVFYEGLELLVEACGILRDQGVDFRLLLVGDGAVAGKVRREISARGLWDQVIMPGRVPHHEVERYYSLIDIAPFPRTASPVTEAVSPLKPFEALAMERAVVVSSVRALTEIITDGENGLVFQKDDVVSLAAALADLIRDEGRRRSLAARGRAWVEEHRQWGSNVRAVDAVYRDLAVEYDLGPEWLEAPDRRPAI